MAMTQQPLDRLLHDLDSALSEDAHGTRVAKLLESYAREAADWRRFAFFEATYYSRNLVRQTDLFELIVLCWGPGQRSPIHDHAGQRCWMAVLDGEVRESMFRVAAGAHTGLANGPVRTVGRGQVAFVVDDLGWHRIESHNHAPAVTLHLYSRPIRECSVFDEDRGVITRKKLSYHSIGGVVQSLRV